MTSRAAVALLAGLAAAAASQSVHSLFEARPEERWLTRFAGPLPTFAGGPSPAFDNPAFFAGARGHEFRLMGRDLGGPASFAASYTGYFQESAAFALSHGYSEGLGRTENTTVVSFGSSGAGLDFGVNLKAMTADGWPAAHYSSSLFALDGDAGIAATFFDRIFAAAGGFNLFSTNTVNNDSFILYPERAVKFSLGGALDAKRRIVLFSEARFDSLHGGAPAGVGIGGGVENHWATSGDLSSRLGYFQYERGLSTLQSFFGGVSYWKTWGLHRAGAEYALRIDQTASHFLLLGYRFRSESDDVSPVATASADLPLLSPNGDGVDDYINFALTAQDDPAGRGIKKWALTIYRKNPGKPLTPVKSFSGSGLPPKAIAWDGRNSRGEIAAPGVYYFELRVLDFSNNEGRSDSQNFQIN